MEFVKKLLEDPQFAALLAGFVIALMGAVQRYLGIKPASKQAVDVATKAAIVLLDVMSASVPSEKKQQALNELKATLPYPAAAVDEAVDIAIQYKDSPEEARKQIYRTFRKYRDSLDAESLALIVGKLNKFAKKVF